MQIIHHLSQAVPLSYADHMNFDSVAVWSLLIAVALVLLEWLLSRRHR